MCARRFNAALQLLESKAKADFENQFMFSSASQNFAITYQCMRQLDEARAYFEQARGELVPLVNARPDDPRYRSALGIVYAGLGMRDDAVREGEKGRELQPLSADAMKAPFRIYAMAQIFLLLGEDELAIDELESLMAIHSDFNPGVLRMSPLWDPIRSNPRFVALVE
jgi:tetratricopeptide (TPR) repeat protein